jgi:hypothetical protein
MKRSGWVIGIALAFLLVVSASRHSDAGIVIEQTMKNREGKVSRVVVYASGDQLRTDDQDGRLTTIVDFKGDRMVMIDHASRQYVEVRLSQWEKDISEGLRKNFPPVSSRQRNIVVKKTAETATLSGFKTQKIQILADSELVEEHWVARDLDMGEYERLMDRASKGFSKEFRSEMKESRDIHEKLKPHGFSIRIRDYAATYGLGGVDVLDVNKIEQRELKPDVFSPPQGYSRVIPEAPKR